MSRKEMHMKKWQAIGFDLDGTLWDACAPVREAWRRELAGLGREERTPTLAQFQSVMGLPPPGRWRCACSPGWRRGRRPWPCPPVHPAENDYLRRHGAAPYPGLEPALARLARGGGCSWSAIVTRGILRPFSTTTAWAGILPPRLRGQRPEQGGEHRRSDGRPGGGGRFVCGRHPGRLRRGRGRRRGLCPRRLGVRNRRPGAGRRAQPGRPARSDRGAGAGEITGPGRARFRSARRPAPACRRLTLPQLFLRHPDSLLCLSSRASGTSRGISNFRPLPP